MWILLKPFQSRFHWYITHWDRLNIKRDNWNWIFSIHSNFKFFNIKSYWSTIRTNNIFIFLKSTSNRVDWGITRWCPLMCRWFLALPITRRAVMKWGSYRQTLMAISTFEKISPTSTSFEHHHDFGFHWLRFLLIAVITFYPLS
jgi:hypothetical protein